MKEYKLSFENKKENKEMNQLFGPLARIKRPTLGHEIYHSTHKKLKTRNFLKNYHGNIKKPTNHKDISLILENRFKDLSENIINPIKYELNSNQNKKNQLLEQKETIKRDFIFINQKSHKLEINNFMENHNISKTLAERLQKSKDLKICQNESCKSSNEGSTSPVYISISHFQMNTFDIPNEIEEKKNLPWYKKFFFCCI